MLNNIKISKTILIILASIITGTSAIGASVYFYSRYQKALKQLQNPQAAGQEELTDITKKIGKMLDLPTGENPTLATVTDVAKLQDQPFFAKAKNGDKVLIYNTARKAILYDPVANKILEVAPLTVASNSAQPTNAKTTPSASGPLNTVLYNGTEVIGLTSTAETELKKKQENISVLLRDNAKKRDYEKTVVIDLTGLKKTETARVASALKAEVGSLPEGETAPILPAGQTADILIIVGKDLALSTASPTSTPAPEVPTGIQ